GFIIFPVLGGYLKVLKNPTIESTKVVLTDKVLRDDIFQFFFITNGEKKLDIEKSVKSTVRGSDEYQRIEFVLPKMKELVKLRLDIGANPKQDTVWIKKIEFIRDNLVIKLDLGGFNKLFEPNIYIKKDEITDGG